MVKTFRFLELRPSASDIVGGDSIEESAQFFLMYYREKGEHTTK